MLDDQSLTNDVYLSNSSDDDADDEVDVQWMGAELERCLLNSADKNHSVLVSLMSVVL